MEHERDLLKEAIVVRDKQYSESTESARYEMDERLQELQTRMDEEREEVCFYAGESSTVSYNNPFLLRMMQQRHNLLQQQKETRQQYEETIQRLKAQLANTSAALGVLESMSG